MQAINRVTNLRVPRQRDIPVLRQDFRGRQIDSQGKSKKANAKHLTTDLRFSLRIISSSSGRKNQQVLSKLARGRLLIEVVPQSNSPGFASPH